MTHPRKLVQAKVETSAALGPGPVTNEDSDMKKSRFTEEQIAYALKQAELGPAAGEICRCLGIAEATFYVWRKKYGGLAPSELKRLRLLEEENRKLKQLVADLSLDKAILKCARNWGWVNRVGNRATNFTSMGLFSAV